MRLFCFCDKILNMDEKLKNLLERGVTEIIVKEHLVKALQSGKKLRVKFGIDPTSPDLHLGHAVVLRKLREFQELEHKIILIIGDLTATIGDPSGRSETRQALPSKEVESNMKEYLKEAGKILDVKKCEVAYNSNWFKKDGLAKLLEIAKAVNIGQVLEREDFDKRIKSGHGITILEELYPIFQGWDSVEVKADVEIGGADQKFNLLMGRRIQRYFGLPEQDIITVPLLEGMDGVRKMSKSYGNYIGLSEKPDEMFGKVMKIPDSLIKKYFLLLTDLEPPKNFGFYETKKLLAETIVKMYHGENAGKKALENFTRVFSKKELPGDLNELKITNRELGIVDLLIATGVQSKSEARRLISQRAVEINGGVRENPEEILTLHKGDVLKIGKKKFFRIS